MPIGSKQCFGSVSGSIWISIEMAPLDPDPHYEYGFLLDPGQSKYGPKRKKNHRFVGDKSIDHITEDLMVFT